MRRKMDNVTITAYLSWLLLIITYIYSVYFIYSKMIYVLDADMSSELVLSKLLSEENSIVTKNWYYPTEMRILNTQLVFMPLFKIFSNWRIVRTIGSAIIYLLVLISYYFLCKQLKIEKYYPYSALILLLPLSDAYLLSGLCGLYYEVYFIVSFIILGLIFYYINNIKKEKFIIFCLSLISIFAGMMGLRYVLLMAMPLTIMIGLYFLIKFEVIKFNPKYNEQTNRFIKISLISIIGILFGYIFNVLLSKIFSFNNYFSIQFKELSVEHIIKTINVWLEVFGYHVGYNIFSMGIIYNGTFILIIILLITGMINIFKYPKYEFNHKILSIYFMIALLIISFVSLFLNLEYGTRYNLPIAILAIPIIIILLFKCNLKQILKRGISSILVICIIFCGIDTYNSKISSQNRNFELDEIANYLTLNEYYDGYSTYWNGNIIKEISSGYINMRIWLNDLGSEDVTNLNQYFRWLQRVDLENTLPDGKFFFLLDRSENEKYTLINQLEDNNIIYQTDNYIVRGFENYQNFMDSIRGYEFKFDSNKYITNGEDIAHKRYLYKDSISYGPYITLYKGTYEVNISGENLDKATVDCIYNNESDLKSLELMEYVNNQDFITYRFIISDETRNIETRVFNNSDDIVILDNISIKKID